MCWLLRWRDGLGYVSRCTGVSWWQFTDSENVRKYKISTEGPLELSPCSSTLPLLVSHISTYFAPCLLLSHPSSLHWSHPPMVSGARLPLEKITHFLMQAWRQYSPSDFARQDLSLYQHRGACICFPNDLSLKPIHTPGICDYEGLRALDMFSRRSTCAQRQHLVRQGTAQGEHGLSHKDTSIKCPIANCPMPLES
jgi:hypothetical protein